MNRKISKKQIHTHLEIVLIDEVKNNSEELLAEYFSTEEQKELEDRHIQTVAGFLAIKKGLSKMCLSVFSEITIEPAQFKLSHDKSGAIQIVAVPEKVGKDLGNFFVSVSHTKKSACGLVVFQDGRHG